MTGYSDHQAVIAETRRMRDLEVITGPCDPGLFPGMVATIRRLRAGQVERGMTLGSFIWPPFCWPVARPDCLLHLWPVESVSWKPAWDRARIRVYLGQEVTITFSGDRAPSTCPDTRTVRQVTGLVPEGEAS